MSRRKTFWMVQWNNGGNPPCVYSVTVPPRYVSEYEVDPEAFKTEAEAAAEIIRKK